MPLTPKTAPKVTAATATAARITTRRENRRAPIPVGGCGSGRVAVRSAEGGGGGGAGLAAGALARFVDAGVAFLGAGATGRDGRAGLAARFFAAGGFATPDPGLVSPAIRRRRGCCG